MLTPEKKKELDGLASEYEAYMDERDKQEKIKQNWVDCGGDEDEDGYE